MTDRGLWGLALVLAVALVGSNVFWFAEASSRTYAALSEASKQQWASEQLHADAVRAARDAMLALPAALAGTPRPEAVARIARAVGDDHPSEDGATTTVGQLLLRFDSEGRLMAVRSRWTPCLVFGNEEEGE